MKTTEPANSSPDHVRRIAVRVLTVVAVALVVVPLLGFLWFVTVLNGGLDDLLSGRGPQETDSRVVAALTQAEKPIEEEAAGLTTLVVASTPGLQARPLARGELPPRCSQGQHDWLRDDPYDLICSKERVELIEIGPRSSLEADMLALDEALRADQWWPTNHLGLADSVLDYRERRMAAQLGLLTPQGEFPQRAGYDRTIDGQNRTLDIGWVTRDSERVSVAYPSEDLVLSDAAGQPRSIESVLHEIPPGGYAVVLRLEVQYFWE